MTIEEIEEQIEYWTDIQDDIGRVIDKAEDLSTTDIDINKLIISGTNSLTEAFSDVEDKLDNLNKELKIVEKLDEDDENED